MSLFIDAIFPFHIKEMEHTQALRRATICPYNSSHQGGANAHQNKPERPMTAHLAPFEAAPKEIMLKVQSLTTSCAASPRAIRNSRNSCKPSRR